MSKRRHRPFRDLAKRLRAREDRAHPDQKNRRFEDLASGQGVVPLAGTPREAIREPPESAPLPPTSRAFRWRDEDGELEGWLVAEGARSIRGLADDEPRATLDLHGRTLAQARRAVLAFLRRRRERGETVVRVVVGKGHHSDGGIGVLRDAIGGWLTSPPAASHVRGFVSASPRNGGAGAVMVRLNSPGLGNIDR